MIFPKRRWRGLLVFFALLFTTHNLWAEYDKPVHAFAMHGEPQYSADFHHFDYVNPNAPRGGETRFAAIGSFDSFNPFIIKGQPAAGLSYLGSGFFFESLMTQSDDEPFTEYGLIAETIEVPEDRSYVIFTLRPEARFHDGSPITVEDVIFSFEVLTTQGHPLYRLYYANVAKVEKLSERSVKFSFSEGENLELPLILGQLPVLSKAYWQDRDFSATTLEPPVGSGPYRIEHFEPGRFIVYKRDENYWGKDLAVNRGLYNFDTMRYDYYRDQTVALEAFKAGAYDIRAENTAKSWATGYDIPALAKGLLIKSEIPHQRTQGMQGYAYNLRRPLFQDARVRQALAYAFDFEWSNRNLFYGQYTRTKSYFDNSELASTGLPSPKELAVLEPFREKLPNEVFTQTYQPPVSGDAKQQRENLRKALELLQQAGWTFKDRKLVKVETGQPFKFEILLVDPGFERITLPFVRSLERLGIEASVRTVDSAQYINRINDFDFDMIVGSWAQSQSPGNEQREFWGSAAADHPGSRNLTGIKDPVVDALVELVISASDRKSLVTRVRALDRVLLWHYLVIPHWHIAYDRIAYWNKFGQPSVIPANGAVTSAWWIDPDKAAALERGEVLSKKN